MFFDEESFAFFASFDFVALADFSSSFDLILSPVFVVSDLSLDFVSSSESFSQTIKNISYN